MSHAHPIPLTISFPTHAKCFFLGNQKRDYFDSRCDETEFFVDSNGALTFTPDLTGEYLFLLWHFSPEPVQMATQVTASQVGTPVVVAPHSLQRLMWGLPA